MHRASLLLPFLLPGLLAAACGGTHDAVVRPYLTPCTDLANRMCMMVAEDGGEPELFYDSIEGYTFRWGVEAKVRYSVEEIDNPPADGSSRRYRLEQTINEEFDDPGTRYEISFPASSVDDDWFTPASASGPVEAVNMMATRVACEQTVCEQLLGGSETAPMRVTFELTAEPLTPLRAISVAR